MKHDISEASWLPKHRAFIKS